jgi:hypothetical protein
LRFAGCATAPDSEADADVDTDIDIAAAAITNVGADADIDADIEIKFNNKNFARFIEVEIRRAAKACQRGAGCGSCNYYQ